jgi:glycosyltransferase involved in cell wall biosynthesis
MYYTPEVGGLESHVAGLAESLARRGHAVRVVTSRSRAGLPAKEEMRGVAVRRSWLPARSPLGWGAFAAASIGPTRFMGRWADLIHAESFASVLPAGIAARAAGIPWLASFHTSHFLRLARSAFWAPVLARLVRWPDRALAASGEIAEVAMGLAPGTRVEPLTNGVDTDRFRPRAGGQGGVAAPSVVVPRRLFEKNGVEYLVRALPEVRARVPNVSVAVVGDGPERPRLEALAAELGVGPSIRFLGSRPHDAMPELLQAAQVAVFPSLMEATSVAALESMACGLPVVATNVGGLPEIIDDEVGRLVPPANPHALAEGMIRLLTDPERDEKGRRARERVVARWSNERLVDRHLEIYAELLAARGAEARSGPGDEP